MKIPLPEEAEADFQMAPMIDMVFLLLVFFMCASHLSVMQNVPLEIPTASKAVVPRDRPSRFVVNIKADGTVYGGNAALGKTGDAETISKLKEMVTEHKDADPETKIYLRADQVTEHAHVRKVMSAMGELGIDDFIFGAFIPGE